MPVTPELSNDEWLEEVRNAHFKRAEFYYRIFVEMRESCGEERALEMIYSATYKAGCAQKQSYENDMKKNTPDEFCTIFCTHSPVGNKLFEMECGESEGEAATANLGRCALVEGWQKLGVEADDIKKLCDAANGTDFGKVESLGLKGEFTELISRGDKRCHMRVTRE